MRQGICTIAMAGVLALFVAGCDDAESPDRQSQSPDRQSQGANTSSAPSEAGPWADDVQAAEAEVTLGTPDTPCPLPVSFDIADGWTPEAVDIDHQQGGADLACEVESPDHLGFVRVWIADDASAPEEALSAFASDDGAENPQHRELRTGEVAGAEIHYEKHLPEAEIDQVHRAFAVQAGDQYVVVHLGGFDATEHEGMLPAYVLARETVAEQR